MTIGEALRHARIAAGLTQQEVADRLGKKRQNVCQWETDTHCPRAHELPAVARAYETTASSIMRLVESEAA